MISQHAFYGKHPAFVYVNNIVERVIDAAGAHQKRIGLIVLNAPKIVNAGVTKNDCMLVFSGLIQTAKTEDEIAFVMGHEIAHLLAEHSQKKSHTSVGTVTVKALSILVGIAADAALSVATNGASERNGLGGTGTTFMDSVGDGLTTLRYSREMELEADRIALYIAAKAGYNPTAAKGWFERMSKDNTHAGFFSSHPNSTDRLENIDKYLPLAISYYNSAPKRPSVFQTMAKQLEKNSSSKKSPKSAKAKNKS